MEEYNYENEMEMINDEMEMMDDEIENEMENKTTKICLPTIIYAIFSTFITIFLSILVLIGKSNGEQLNKKKLLIFFLMCLVSIIGVSIGLYFICKYLSTNIAWYTMIAAILITLFGILILFLKYKRNQKYISVESNYLDYLDGLDGLNELNE